MSGVDIAGLVERLRDERHCNDWYLRQEAADALDEALAALKASEEARDAATKLADRYGVALMMIRAGCSNPQRCRRKHS